MRYLIDFTHLVVRALARLRITVALRRDRGLCYDWRRAWRTAGRLA